MLREKLSGVEKAVAEAAASSSPLHAAKAGGGGAVAAAAATSRIDALARRLEGMEARLSKVESGVAAMAVAAKAAADADAGAAAVGARVGRLEADFASVIAASASASSELAALQSRLGDGGGAGGGRGGGGGSGAGADVREKLAALSARCAACEREASRAALVGEAAAFVRRDELAALLDVKLDRSEWGAARDDLLREVTFQVAMRVQQAQQQAQQQQAQQQQAAVPPHAHAHAPTPPPQPPENATAPRAANVAPHTWSEANWQNDLHAQRRAPPPPQGRAPPQQAWASGGGGGGAVRNADGLVETRRLVQSQFGLEGNDGRIYRGAGVTATTSSGGAFPTATPCAAAGAGRGAYANGGGSEPLRRPASRPSSAGVRTGHGSGHHQPTCERPSSASAKTRAALAPTATRGGGGVPSGPATGGYVTPSSSAFSRRLAETGEVHLRP